MNSLYHNSTGQSHHLSETTSFSNRAQTRAVNLHHRVLKVFQGCISFIKLFIFFQDHNCLFTGTSVSHEAPQRSRIIFSLYLCHGWYYVQNVVNLFVIRNMSIILNVNMFLFNTQASTLIILFFYIEFKNYRLFLVFWVNKSYYMVLGKLFKCSKQLFLYLL